MNNSLLWAAGAAVVVVLVLAAVLLLRRRPPQRTGQASAPAERSPVAPSASRAAGHAGQAVPQSASSQGAPIPAAAAGAPAGSAEAQRQAAIDALRQARRRQAEEAARQAAQLEAQAQAKAEARAQAQADADAAADLAALARIHADALASAQAQARAVAAARAAPVAPVAPVAPKAAALLPVPTAKAAPITPSAPVAPAVSRPPTVLLADDSKVVRVKTGRLLEKQGWRVLLAEDGESALQLLAAEAPDLLITDVEMPGVDGFELTRRVRQHPRWGRLPVIMITSSDDKHRADAQAAGVNLLMGKPYAEEDLLAQAQRLLGRRVQAGTALH